jgi:hypothetical protein
MLVRVQSPTLIAMESDLLINADELMADLEAHGEHLEDLIIRTREQNDDIRELDTELERLKRDSTISSEDATAI